MGRRRVVEEDFQVAGDCVFRRKVSAAGSGGEEGGECHGMKGALRREYGMWRGVSSGWGRVCDVAGVSGWLSETWVFLYGDVTREGCATGVCVWVWGELCLHR